MNLRVSQKQIRYIVVIILCATLLGTLISNIVRSTHNKGDFIAIYNASLHAIKIHSLNDPESLGYYPPSARPIFLCFAFLPKVIAMTLWWLISVLCYVFAFYLSAKYLIPICDSNQSQDNLAQDDIEKFDQGNITQDNVDQGNFAQDNFVQNNLTQNNFARDNFTQGNLTKNNLIRDNFTQDNSDRDNCVRDNFTQSNFTQNNLIRDNFTQDNFGRDNCVRDNSAPDNFAKDNCNNELSSDEAIREKGKSDNFPSKCNSTAIIAITFLLSLPWLISDLNVGNVSVIVLMSILISYVLHIKNKQLLSAFVLAIGIATKLIPIFLLIFYAIRRKWRQTILTLICLPIVGIIPGVIIFGYKDFSSSWNCWRQNAVNIRTAKYIITETDRLNYMNQAWPNVLARALHHINSGHRNHPFYVNFANLPKNTILLIWYIFAAISFGFWLYAIKPEQGITESHIKISERIAFGLVPPAILWFSPHMLSYYLTILIPSLMLIVGYAMNPLPKTEEIKCEGLNDLSHNALRRKLRIIIALYLLLCVSPAFATLRALGSYQIIVLLCFLGVYFILRDNSIPLQTGQGNPKISA